MAFIEGAVSVTATVTVTVTATVTVTQTGTDFKTESVACKKSRGIAAHQIKSRRKGLGLELGLRVRVKG